MSDVSNRFMSIDIRFWLYCDDCRASFGVKAPQMFYYCPYCNEEIKVDLGREEKFLKAEELVVNSIVKTLSEVKKI